MALSQQVEVGPNVKEPPFHVVATVMIGEAAEGDNADGYEILSIIYVLNNCHIPDDEDDRVDLVNAVRAFWNCECFQKWAQTDGMDDLDVEMTAALLQKLGVRVYDDMTLSDPEVIKDEAAAG